MANAKNCRLTDLADGPESASAKKFADAKPLNKPMLHWFYKQYLATNTDPRHAYVSPLYAELTGLPPATIFLAEIDPLCSEGEAYATRLQKASVPVSVKIYEGVTHEFFGLAGLVNEAGAAVAFAARELRKAFSTQQGTMERVLDKVGL